MPLPWKKTKPNRISRIVTDLQAPSRVVETGFPTSVVDLFVKNRDRIKRQSLKKTKHNPIPLHVSESVAPTPPPTPSLTPHNSPRLPHHHPATLPPPPDVPHPNPHNNANASASANSNSNSNSNSNPNSNANSNFPVFVLAAKMFLAVVPLLTTKKLALGITLSALLLFLFEIFGQFLARFLNPSSIRNRLAAERRRGGGRPEEQEFPPINSASNNEIQIAESNSDCEREPFQNPEKGVGGCSSDLELENDEEEKLEMGNKNQRSRSSKLRAKIIEKLIPKKLRSGKRLKMNKSEKKKMKEEGGIMIVENEQGTESSCEEEEQEVWEVQQVWEPEEEEEEEEEIGSSTLMVKGEERDQRKMNLECKIVILMILLGLCWGRFLALVLTVSGCFIFRFINFSIRNGNLGKG